MLIHTIDIFQVDIGLALNEKFQDINRIGTLIPGSKIKRKFSTSSISIWISSIVQQQSGYFNTASIDCLCYSHL